MCHTDQFNDYSNVELTKVGLPSVVRAMCLVQLLYCAHWPERRLFRFPHDALLPEPLTMTSQTLEIELLHDAISSARLLSDTVATINPTANYSTGAAVILVIK